MKNVATLIILKGRGVVRGQINHPPWSAGEGKKAVKEEEEEEEDEEPKEEEEEAAAASGACADFNSITSAAQWTNCSPQQQLTWPKFSCIIGSRRKKEKSSPRSCFKK